LIANWARTAHPLQDLIDTSYQQFVQTVAEARNLALDAVKSFADGRIFAGRQAVGLGVVDRLGTGSARQAAELAGLDPDKPRCHTLEERKPILTRLLSGEKSGIIRTTSAGVDWVEFKNCLPVNYL